MGQNPSMLRLPAIFTGRRPAGAVLGLVLALALGLAPSLHQALETGPADQDCEVCAHLARDAAPPPATVEITRVYIDAETPALPADPLQRSDGSAPPGARGPPALIV